MWRRSWRASRCRWPRRTRCHPTAVTSGMVAGKDADIPFVERGIDAVDLALGGSRISGGDEPGGSLYISLLRHGAQDEGAGAGLFSARSRRSCS